MFDLQLSMIIGPPIVATGFMFLLLSNIRDMFDGGTSVDPTNR